MLRSVLLFLLFLLLSVQLFAQQSTQTIRGNITDDASNEPLVYVSVNLQNTPMGSVTDSAGNFTIKNVPVGRYNIMASFVGYEPVVLREIQVTSAKEVFLNITLKESLLTLEEVVVKPKVNKEQPLNSMATVSAKMLSIDEAKRYAGGFDDPARLVSAFAGVSGNTGNNAIVVRGNNPQSLQWKLEGIEISNPNHFADLSVFGGGALTALSVQLLTNSDFFSGAMPAEYSNALSGVFDIFMRNGNNQKHEHTFQLGAIGIDVASEGPFKKGGKSSYIFNYRYSTVGLLTSILPENAAGTTYQDLSFKLNFPTKKAGTFSIWGMGLIDYSDAKAKDNKNEWKYDSDKENLEARQFVGATGVSHKIFLNNGQYLKTTLAATANGIDMYSEKLDNNLNSHPCNVVNNKYYNFIASSFLNTKFSARHTNKSGLVFTNMNYDMRLKNAVSTGSPMQTLVNETGSSTLISAYSNSAINFNEKITANVGLTSQWFLLNNTFSIEPRAGVKYRFAPTQILSLAYGLHSRLERLNYYFIKDSLARNINKDLSFTKAHHLVLGYDIGTSEFTHLKIEAYYQHLFDVPVTAVGTFSLINQQNDWFFDKKLQNSGYGKNYGLDFTFEKYFSKGYYYMATVSLFNSQYKGSDNVWRNTLYNRNFAINVLAGKEWLLGKNKNHILSLNARMNYQGGDRYSPIETTLSVALQDVVFDETRAYSQQFSPAFTTHFTASYKVNKKKTAHEFALKILNLTQYKEYLGFRYNYQTRTVDADREATFVPNISYRVDF
ncbi:MAG: TonB-dependent receptor [Bacteroidales bacterium]|jgi:hypothetical protein|nr:TonB-dependent receptor [Bacteroidales bacterium]